MSAKAMRESFEKERAILARPSPLLRGPLRGFRKGPSSQKRGIYFKPEFQFLM